MNLALNKPAYQTDTYVDHGTHCLPGFAVDGITSHVFKDHYCSHTNTYDATWEVDLGELCAVESVVIYNRAESGKYNIMQTRICLSRFLVTHQHVRRPLCLIDGQPTTFNHI